MPSRTSQLTITPLPSHLRKSTSVGALVTLPSSNPLLDLSLLSVYETALLRASLYEHGILVFRNQKGIPPSLLPEICKLFDPEALDMHSGGKDSVKDSKNILADNKAVRLEEEKMVSVIGKGNFRMSELDGLAGGRGKEGKRTSEGQEEEVPLRHVDHTTFHATPLSASQIRQGCTRPYRWHMDAPLYDVLPGNVTVLHSILNPNLPDQKILFPDGQSMDVAAGATAFISGAQAFRLLSKEEQDFALRTTVHYAPRAYEWIRDCKATSDGLSIASVGAEKRLEDLPSWEEGKVHSFPMIWRNPSTNEPSLQILGCCVYALSTSNTPLTPSNSTSPTSPISPTSPTSSIPSTPSKTVITDLAEVRRICHTLQRKAYASQYVYAHRWETGDLVIFHNRGVWHSITGQLEEDTTPGQARDGFDGKKEQSEAREELNGGNEETRRLFWQCSLGSQTAPEAFLS